MQKTIRFVIRATVAALVFYGVLVAVAYTVGPPGLEAFKQSVSSNTAFSVGIPVSAVGAFVIVVACWQTFPPARSETAQEISLKAFGLEFTGPSGPITLWIACFWTLVGAMRLLGPSG